jgi:hypothetical protein
MLDAVKDDAAEWAAVGGPLLRSGSHKSETRIRIYTKMSRIRNTGPVFGNDLFRIRILLKRYLPVLDAVKDDTAEGAAVGGPLLRGQVGQLMLLQLSLKPA